jgi:hypothetical protein
VDFETLRVHQEGAVWFAAISAPPMNLIGTDLVSDLAISLAPADDFRRDSDLFLECARDSEAQRRTDVAMARGFQTRDGEMALGSMVRDLAER